MASLTKFKKQSSPNLGLSRIHGCHGPSIQPDSPPINWVDTHRTMLARLWLGLLPLAYLLTMKLHKSNCIPLSSNSSQNALAAPNPTSAPTKADGNALLSQPVPSLSYPLFHLCTAKRLRPTNINVCSSYEFNLNITRSTMWEGKNRSSLYLLFPHLVLFTREELRLSNLIGLRNMCSAGSHDTGQY